MSKLSTIGRGLMIVMVFFTMTACLNNNPDTNPPVTPSETYTGFLTVSNGKIVDEEAKPIALRGFNVSGWLLNENWINPGFTILGGDEHESQLRNFLDNLYPGQDMGKRFTDEFRHHFITRGDFAYCKSLGVNHLRLNVSHLLLENGERGFLYIDDAITWAQELGLYVTISLITVPGCANTLDYCDINKQANLWTDINNFNQLNELWLAIASRYKDKSAVAGYNLINEPNSPNSDTLKESYRRLIETIRTVDQKHIIFLDGDNYAANFDVFADGALAAIDNNLVYGFHLYTGSTCNPLANWERNINTFVDDPIFNKVTNQNVPIWLGEYAGHCAEWIQLVHRLMRDKGVEHLSYYSPKCAGGGTFDDTKCLAKLTDTALWQNLLTNTKDGLLNMGWEDDAGFRQLDYSNFSYDSEKIDALFN